VLSAASRDGGVHGYTGNKDDYLRRLRRIEGQVRGLQRMVEDDKYCIGILTHVSAATRALESVALGLLEELLGHCARREVAEGSDTATPRSGRRRTRYPGREGSAGAGQTRKVSEMATATCEVTGMTCQHCVRAVTGELSAPGRRRWPSRTGGR